MVEGDAPAAPTGNSQRRQPPGEWARLVPGLVVWVALLASTVIWVRFIPAFPLDEVSPFVGWLRVLPPLRWLLPVAVGGVLVAALPALARRMRWRPLLLVSVASAAAWASSLAATTGLGGFVQPLRARHEYVHDLPALDVGAGEFVRTFVERLPSYVTHTRGHPPGPLLVLHALEKLRLPVVPAEAVLVVAAGSAAVAAVAVTVRVLAGEASARRMLPFLVLAPMAVWVATSMDAFFLGVSAWGVALLALATQRPGRVGHLLALGAGLVLGFGLYLTYALAAFGLLPLAVLAARRRNWLLVPAGVGVATVVAAFTLGGFWWFDGVEATHVEWLTSAGPRRPYWYFLLANAAVLAFMVGPATVACLGALRDRRVWWLVGAALLVLLASDVGGYERGEVGRIWLPFAVWLVPATAALPDRMQRVALAANVALATALQGLAHLPW